MEISIKLQEFKMAQQKRQPVESLQRRQFSSDQAEFWYKYTQRDYLQSAKVSIGSVF
jgi:hypothetical protein